MHDYGARNYDPALGRWINVDPLAEEYQKWSPYTYCVDNPVLFIDPNGMYVSWQQGNEDYGKVDPQGRNRYDRFGMYVPAFERKSDSSGGYTDSFAIEGGDESNGDGSESTSQEPDPPFNLVEFFLDIIRFQKRSQDESDRSVRNRKLCFKAMPEAIDTGSMIQNAMLFSVLIISYI